MRRSPWRAAAAPLIARVTCASSWPGSPTSCPAPAYGHHTAAAVAPLVGSAWAWLLPQERRVAAGARRRGGQPHAPQVRAATPVGRIGRSHGPRIRQVEPSAVAALRQRRDRARLDRLVRPRAQPRRRAGRPAALHAAGDAAVAAAQASPPAGVWWADRARVPRHAVPRPPAQWRRDATWDRNWRRISCL